MEPIIGDEGRALDATVASYSVVHGRDGGPELAYRFERFEE